MKRIVTFALLLVATARTADACQCGRRATPEIGMRTSEAVFEGRVVARRMVLGEEHGWFFPIPEYEFRVSRAWKGVTTPAIRLLGGYSNCGYVFGEGTTYLVFAAPHWEKPGRLSSSICDPTRPADEARAAVAILGKPVAVFAPDRDRSHPSLERLRADAVAGIAVFANAATRHDDSGLPISDVGVAAPVLAMLAAGVLLAALVSVRKWRRFVALLLLSALLATASLMVAGHRLYGDTWFSRFVE